MAAHLSRSLSPEPFAMPAPAFSSDSRLMPFPALAAGLLALMLAGAASAATARIEEGSKLIGKGEAAEFRISSSPDESSELRASCEVSAGGDAGITFDGEHYIPLSEPSVGDVLTITAGETRRFDLAGTVEKNRGDAYIAFSFHDVPASMCFPGMVCESAPAGAKNVSVACRNVK